MRCPSRSIFGEETVRDAVDLVADVVDFAARGGKALELSAVRTVEADADGDLVVGRDQVFDMGFEIGESAPHHLEAFSPCIAPRPNRAAHMAALKASLRSGGQAIL
jgi:hypothetical protein